MPQKRQRGKGDMSSNSGIFGLYWWVAVLIIAAALTIIFVRSRSRKKKRAEAERAEQVLQDQVAAIERDLEAPLADWESPEETYGQIYNLPAGGVIGEYRTTLMSRYQIRRREWLKSVRRKKEDQTG